MSSEKLQNPERPSRDLQILPAGSGHQFTVPVKRINDGEDVSFFLTSRAYTDLMTFLLSLNASMFPRQNSESSTVKTFDIGTENLQCSPVVMQLKTLLGKCENFITEAPPDPGPRRFGNASFRKWFNLVEERLPQLLDEYLPVGVLQFDVRNNPSITAKDEIKAYLLGSFGSSQRLDYGTGHELSFLAFLGCIWKLGGFANGEPEIEERGIILGVIEP
jgi:serine/threonine-protein phosphatase 2A activator